ncbi:MAG: NAD(P)H-dependent oxidoreductase [Erysipelotrichales bacterium]|nr:NAD(P)H-dependent oxidoreductase [Erysipelotrichales bacterium]
MRKKVMIIVGSLRERSFNKQLAQVIAKELEHEVEVEILEYSNIPYMNQDIEFPAPLVIQALREKMEKVDGYYIVTPEYNGSYPGLLKNLLDWMSRTIKPNDFEHGSPVTNRKVAIAGAGGRAAAIGAREKLDELLRFMGMDVMEQQLGLALSGESFMKDEMILSYEDQGKIKEHVRAYLSFLGNM